MIGYKGEIWKDIKGYEGLYQASNFGRIKSLIGWNGQQYIQREKILKPTITEGHYASISMHKNKKSKVVMIHRIIAETFLENPNNYPHVMHIDENKYNNQVDNLQWGTAKENCNFPLHKRRIAKSMSGKIGELNNFYGRTHTDETKKKIAEKRIGIYIKGKNPRAKKVECEGIIFDCIMDCAEYYSMHYSTMSRYLNHTEQMPDIFKEKGLRFYDK